MGPAALRPYLSVCMMVRLVVPFLDSYEIIFTTRSFFHFAITWDTCQLDILAWYEHYLKKDGFVSENLYAYQMAQLFIRIWISEHTVLCIFLQHLGLRQLQLQRFTQISILCCVPTVTRLGTRHTIAGNG